MAKGKVRNFDGTILLKCGNCRHVTRMHRRTARQASAGSRRSHTCPSCHHVLELEVDR